MFADVRPLKKALVLYSTTRVVIEFESLAASDQVNPYNMNASVSVCANLDRNDPMYVVYSSFVRYYHVVPGWCSTLNRSRNQRERPAHNLNSEQVAE